MRKYTFLKIVYVFAIIIVALGIIYIALEETVPDLIPVIENGNVDEIQTYIRESGTFRGILCTVLLQMVQVWSLFISGMPIQVAAGCVFGFFAAFVICHLSSVAAHYISINVWRKMGQRLEKWMPVNVNKNNRFKEFLDSKAPPAYIVILACMIPVMPNGLIPLLASKMEINVKEYTITVWAGSALNILICCAVGSRIIQGDWVIACIFLLVLIVLFILMWVFRDRILELYKRATNKNEMKTE